MGLVNSVKGTYMYMGWQRQTEVSGGEWTHVCHRHVSKYERRKRGAENDHTMAVGGDMAFSVICSPL